MWRGDEGSVHLVVLRRAHALVHELRTDLLLPCELLGMPPLPARTNTTPVVSHPHGRPAGKTAAAAAAITRCTG